MLSSVDKGQRKRTADVAEKLGVGLLLGALLQGILAERLSPGIYGLGAIVIAIAIGLIAFAIVISKEE